MIQRVVKTERARRRTNFIRVDTIDESVDYEKLCKRCLKVERARRKNLATPARRRLGSP